MKQIFALLAMLLLTAGATGARAAEAENRNGILKNYPKTAATLLLLCQDKDLMDGDAKRTSMVSGWIKKTAASQEQGEKELAEFNALYEKEMIKALEGTAVVVSRQASPQEACSDAKKSWETMISHIRREMGE